MELTNDDASKIVRLILAKLEAINASAVLEGIAESRRLGIEERVDALSWPDLGWAKDLKQLGTVRRRPPTELELLRLVFERLHQRLIVIPAVVRALQERLKSDAVVWRVDTEFVSADRSHALEAHSTDLLPEDVETIATAYQRIRELIPQHLPGGNENG